MNEVAARAKAKPAIVIWWRDTYLSPSSSGKRVRLYFNQALLDPYPSDIPVMVIDDEPDVLEALKMILEPLGFHVLAASSQEEAIRIGSVGERAPW